MTPAQAQAELDRRAREQQGGGAGSIMRIDGTQGGGPRISNAPAAQQGDGPNTQSPLYQGDKPATATVSPETAQAELDKRTAAASMGPEDTVIPGLHVARAWQAMQDLGNVGAQGLTLGFSDEIKAALAASLTGEDYATAKANEQAKIHDAKVRMNAQTPSSGATFEALTSMVGPGGAVKMLPKANLLGRALNYGLEGAATGATSAYGHDTDPVTGAIIGGAGGVLGPFAGAATGKIVPWGSAVLGGKLGFLSGGNLIGAGLGAKYGKMLGNQVQSALHAGAGMLMSPETQRELLARLSVAPGALYGQVTGGE